MKFLILLPALLLSAAVASAQTAGKIKGKITNAERSVQGATVSLLHAADSSTVKLTSSDKDGNFLFENISFGKYKLTITAIGHLPFNTKSFEISADRQDVQLPTLTMVPVSKEMSAVTVTSKKQFIEERIDRTIVNVEASITNIGTTALDVLEKSPGVAVDRDGNISLKGKEGVLIMIDGRPTQLGGQDLANLLRGMNSSQLDQIEIMTNPPAKYDASGTSGIINIKTKKSITVGMNGSLNLSYGQGKYPKTNEAFNFNYRSGKINFFSNLNHNYVKRYSILSLGRNILDNSNNLDKVFDQEANRVASGHSYNAKLGLDYFATKKTTLGVVLNLNSRDLLSNNPNVTQISNAAKELQSITNALVRTDTRWKSINTNFNFRTLIGNKGKELTSDIDIVKHRTDGDLFMVNAYTDGDGNNSQKSDTLTGLLPQDINIYAARVDYLHPLKNNGRFEAGIKSGIVSTDNNAIYDSIINGEIVRDINRSNHFVYRENINAAYVNLSGSLSKKLTAQFGLRLEHTNAKGKQKSTGDDFSRQYVQLFPTAFLQYKTDEKNSFTARYGRRVTRPSYQSLNPFIRFIDRYTYSQGNPALKPSVSNNYELSHTWKNQITTTLNYTHVADIIQEVISQKGEEAYNMPSNVSKLDQVGISVSANTPIRKWWSSNINVNLFHDKFNGHTGTAPIDLEATSFILNITQQFKLNKTLTLELNGRYRNGWLEGVLMVEPVGFVGGGLSQQILKNKGTIRFTARDMFHTQKFTGRSKYGNVDFTMSQVAETQVFTLGFTYNFSKGKKITPVKRSTGSASEEQNRID